MLYISCSVRTKSSLKSYHLGSVLDWVVIHVLQIHNSKTHRRAAELSNILATAYYICGAAVKEQNKHKMKGDFFFYKDNGSNLLYLVTSRPQEAHLMQSLDLHVINK
jgi:hypothetical protein